MTTTTDERQTLDTSARRDERPPFHPPESAMTPPLLLAATRETRCAQNQAEVRVIRLAEQYARACRPPTESGAPGGCQGMLFGGEGTTPANEFIVSEFALALGASEGQAHQLLADSVELIYRLPLLWDRVAMGLVEVWRARRIARASVVLTLDAAALVDARIAGCAEFVGPVRLARLIAAVAAECGEQDRLAQVGGARHVEVRQADASDATIVGVVDPPDARAFDAELSRIASALLSHGDDASLDERRAKAIGVIASPERHAAVFTEDGIRAGQRPEIVLHVTMTEAAVREPSAGPADHATPDPAHQDVAGARTPVDCGPLGPRLIDQVREWAGHSRVTVRPIIDAHALGSVDSYHVPAAMREAMERRRPRCVFPNCGRDARSCEADHIEPLAFADGDDDLSREKQSGARPPARTGQTRLENLAPLCKHHHRLKTHGGWDYRPVGPTTFVWTSPAGQVFVTGSTGTHRIGQLANGPSAPGLGAPRLATSDPPAPRPAGSRPATQSPPGNAQSLWQELAALRRDLQRSWRIHPLPPVDFYVPQRFVGLSARHAAALSGNDPPRRSRSADPGGGADPPF